MGGKGYIKVLVIVWAVATIPFIIVGYGYSSSLPEFLAGLMRAFATVPTLSKLAFNVFFFSPWIAIAAFVATKIYKVLIDRNEL